MKRFLGYPTVRIMGGVGGAAAASQLAALLAAPVLARLYPPEAFGLFGALNAYSNIATTLMLLGLGDAILAAHDDDAAADLLSAGMKLGAVFLVPVTAFTAAAIMLGWFGLGQLPMLALAIIVPLLMALLMASLLQAFLINRQSFSPLATGYLALGGVRAAGQIAGGLAGTAFGGLAVGEVAGRIAADTVMARGTGAAVLSAARAPAAQWRRTLWAYRHFPLQRTPSALLNALAVGSPVLMMTSLYGPAPAGQFALMFTMLMGPIALIQRAIGDVFTGQFGTLYRADPASGIRFAARFAAGLAALGIVAAVVLYTLGQWIFATVFGPQWAPAGAMAAACAPWIAVLIVTMPLGQILIVTHRPVLKLIFDVLYCAGLVGLFAWAQSAGPSPLLFVARLSVLSALTYALLGPLIVFALRHPGAILRTDR